MTDTTTTIARGIPAPPPELPDTVRARVRTAAQALWGVLWAMLARWVAQRYGWELPVEIPDELSVILTGAVVGLFAAAWMFVVARISRYLPAIERVFIMGGRPVYVEPVAPPRAGNGG
jgi:hypothetical protein